MTEITLEELLAAIAEAENGPNTAQRGMTSVELQKHWGIGETAVSKRLRQARDLGWLRVGRKPVESIIGTKIPTPCYWFEKPRQPKTAARAKRT